MSLPSYARKCGFCTHRFISRQDRIDHIAEHFKNGKCMLDWSEDDDQHDSDDMNDDDDNDDRPDNGGFGSGKPHSPPRNDPRGSGSGSKDNGSDGSGAQPPQGGFYQFQVSQLAEDDSRDVLSALEQQCGTVISDKQRIQPTIIPNAATNSESSQVDAYHTKSDDQSSSDGRHDETEGGDSQNVARDVVSMKTDIVQLQMTAPYVPPNDGDPVGPDRQHTITSRPSGMCSLAYGLIRSSDSRTAVLNRETQDLLGSLKLLGTGGFSTVDEVVHRKTSLRFARKTLKNRERSALEELKNEVEVLQKLRHPHIIRFVGSVQKDNKMSILLSPVAETTLAAWLDMKQQNRPEGLSQTIVKMLGCLASSIRYLHEQRPAVKHMDVKPQNILVKEGEEFPHVILSDFGVSSIGDLTTKHKAMPLTRQYCAPEVSEGTSRELASDIWSLGCVFLEMLTVAYKDDNSTWLEFRKLFGGRKGKYYWQDVPALQGLLAETIKGATTQTEANAARAVENMLNSEPAQRPTAPMLTMVFVPAPCCLSWPNETATYPGPDEELQTMRAIFREDEVDGCTHLDCSGALKPSENSIPHAKRWLEECSHEHDACRHDPQEFSAHQKLPTRLIDILPDGQAGVSVRIVNSADLDGRTSPDFAAVSYLWTEDELKLSTDRLESMQVDIPREALPSGISQAVAKAQDIGFRYIWVDNLCVIQDSEKDKERECRATADVYRNAALTIVLDQFKVQASDVAKNHNRDLSTSIKMPEPQQALVPATLPLTVYLTPAFGWDTRAWSLQERLLSRRFLHIGEEQMYWECNALKASETFPQGYEAFQHAFPSLFWEKVHTKRAAVADGIHRQQDDKQDKFDVEGTGSTVQAGEVTQCISNGRDVPLECKLMGYGKMATPHHEERKVDPHVSRDCQFCCEEDHGFDDLLGAARAQQYDDHKPIALRRSRSTSNGTNMIIDQGNDSQNLGKGNDFDADKEVMS